ncbi:glycoside hydrolase family 61 protein [Laccaria bicolor S238N-H82]|uniref:AA9 family lytic polysaccharide monooxygenase n=1 Tax=Laccaria bicolor (strain S238N-H82 / ATCC MYA-4686) TaxID=486041 RepID=B0DPG3_LACBS|nr:glycoside hydrolase family 61 protein [Laccaria bicolor S238N-H82]EDR03447.1 glycoside hydrolase family 61 protein [Laccaria bicolor S238N-H82]|eukprot:XP_001885903.1 glycoside hydrolase family 61 protein [Laccaria bicolor S238N-H82]
MKFSAILGFCLLAAQSTSAHYIFNTLIAGSKTSTQAVRQPLNNTPFHDITSSDATCNHDPGNASETVQVNAGDTIGFNVDVAIYHKGPAAIYLGQSPTDAFNWDGSGQHWFKIAEWGANFDPFSFTDLGLSQLTTTIPNNVPSGQYLVRVEQAGLHLGTGVVEWFVSCAQIEVMNGGSGNPSKVAIPGYLSNPDPELTLNIYYPVPTSYTVPGPAVYRG